jgi:hypothetical protein
VCSEGLCNKFFKTACCVSAKLSRFILIEFTRPKPHFSALNLTEEVKSGSESKWGALTCRNLLYNESNSLTENSCAFRKEVRIKKEVAATLIALVI